MTTSYASPPFFTDWGLIFRSCEIGEVRPGTIKEVSTGVKIKIPPFIFGRSFSPRLMIDKNVGQISRVYDSSFDGILKINVINQSDKIFYYNKHTVITILTFAKYIDMIYELV